MAGARPGRQALFGKPYVDQKPLSEGLKTVVRVTLLVAPILVSLGFFLSVLSPKAESATQFFGGLSNPPA
ncbi:MAG TPA: hypothetical protein VK736_12375 [Candidatus Binatia bacterium]|nr:hypothetical protein [Candidatus Binatia bacterium]